MGFRFRKSKKIGGLRINFSKKGIGASVGTKGARYTLKAGGGTRKTVGIPGTGVSFVSEGGSKKRRKGRYGTDQGTGARSHYPYFACAFVMKVVGIFMTALCALITLVSPVVGIIGVTVGVLELLYSKSLKKKGIQQALEEAEAETEEVAAAQ